MRRLIAAAVLLAAAPAVAQKAVGEAEATALLRRPVRVDAKSAAVLRRAHGAYSRLQSLLTVSSGGGTRTVTRLKRPRYYHSVQSKSSGELITLSISDGKQYYEHSEATLKYLQRPASVLSGLALPINARPFFVDVALGDVMKDVMGRAQVREYAFSYAGEKKVGGRAADRLRVSTLVRAQDGWRRFDSMRSYDRKTGFLVRISSGPRSLTIRNEPNAPLLTRGFVWKPVPGSTRSFD